MPSPPGADFHVMPPSEVKMVRPSRRLTVRRWRQLMPPQSRPPDDGEMRVIDPADGRQIPATILP